MLVGDSGSGKTTGPLSAIAIAAHRAHASVVHTCIKPSDSELWQTIAQNHGRNDIRIFRPGVDTFNPLACAQTRAPGGLAVAEDMTALALIPLKRQQRTGTGGDGFWITQTEQGCRSIITMCILAGIAVTYRLIHETFQTLPTSPEEVNDPAWQARCPAFGILQTASEREMTDVEQTDFATSCEWLLVTMARMPEKTRASIQATVCGALDPLVRGVIGQTLNADADTWHPREVVDAPSVFVMNILIQMYGEVGAVLQRILLTSIQEAVLRRKITPDSHPVLLICDEYQEILDGESDPRFMRTARDRLSCMVISTQCVANITAACADARDPRAAAESILGLCSAKMFGSCGDPETLKYAEAVFTQTMQAKISFSQSSKSGGSARGDQNATMTREMLPDVPANQLAALRRGGPENGWQVEVFCAVSGRVWKASRRPSLKVVFMQTRLGPR